MERKTGQSTRILDKAIQQFFIYGEVDLADHIGTKRMRDWILQRFLDRLSLEHSIYKKDLYMRPKDSYTFIKLIRKYEQENKYNSKIKKW